MLSDWVNGETERVDHIAEFSISEGSDGKWHAFVKYVEELEE